MTWPLRQRWFWVLFVMLLVVLIVPFVLVQLVLKLHPAALVGLLIAAIVVWIIFRSYRDFRAREDKQVKTDVLYDSVLKLLEIHRVGVEDWTETMFRND